MRNPEQSLDGPLTMLIEAIEAYSKVVDIRIKSFEWNEGHILQINKLRLELLEKMPLLVGLREETW